MNGLEKTLLTLVDLVFLSVMWKSTPQRKPLQLLPLLDVMLVEALMLMKSSFGLLVLMLGWMKSVVLSMTEFADFLLLTCFGSAVEKII